MNGETMQRPRTFDLGPAYSDLPDDVVISVRNVSKKFCRNLRRSMAYGIKDLTCNLAGIRQDSTTLRKHEFWALDDIDIEIKRGESVGVIGANGSGKTTLFRLVHGIFPPDKGSVAVRGRIGALIALGAGFHPHMTGRENVFLNASVLGISQEEISAKLPEIEEFAEIGAFIDAPVSTYSSGMRVRLGFAVAAHINPDVLLIDEVLAVGDLAFRNKCMRYMKRLVSADRTIMFVSHSMPNVQLVCDRAILLNKGKIIADGPTDDVVTEYYRRTSTVILRDLERGEETTKVTHSYSDDRALYMGAEVLDSSGHGTPDIEMGSSFTLSFKIRVFETLPAPLMSMQLICVRSGIPVAFGSMRAEKTLSPGNHVIKLQISSLGLMPGVYQVESGLGLWKTREQVARAVNLAKLNIVPSVDDPTKGNDTGYLRIEGEWTIEPATENPLAALR